MDLIILVKEDARATARAIAPAAVNVVNPMDKAFSKSPVTTARIV